MVKQNPDISGMILIW